jgi:DNA repair protein RadA/Sms
MAKRTHQYVCQQCGNTYPKWAGKCDNCGAWNSLVEEAVAVDKKAVVDRSSGRALTPANLADVKVD